MLKMLSVSAALLSFLVLDNASACQCLQIPVARHFAGEQAVFVGRIISRQWLEGGVYVVEMRVTKSWKGVRKGEVVRLCSWGFGGCEYPIDRSWSHLIFASAATPRT